MKTSTIETWRAIAGYEGEYEVSDFGRVRSLDRVVDGPRGQLRRNGKVLSPSIANGYEHLALCKNGLRKYFLVHRLVAASFIGHCPVGRQINHIDGKKLNNRPSNLEYVTQSENTLHAYRTGLLKSMCGVDSPHAKLTDKDVLEIRAAYAAGGITMKKIAYKYEVGHSQIRRIIQRQKWAHLPPD